MDDVKQLIEQNDTDLKEREDELILKINTAYEKALKEVEKDFEYLSKLNPNIKPTRKQIAKIIEKMIKSFRSEFNELVGPLRDELVKQYEEGLKEAATIVAIGEKK